MKNEWNDLVNAMTVKELRQDINSNWIKFGSLVLALGLTYGAMMLFKGEMTLKGFQMSFMETVYSGTAMFYLGTGAMAVGCLGFGGLLEMFRFSRERSVPDLDVGNFTSMSPLRMAWGRFLSELIMCLYVYAVCLPSVVSAYYLQGITLESILLTHLYVLVVVIALNLAMLWVGAQGKPTACFSWLLIGAMLGFLCCAPYGYLLYQRDFASPTLVAIEIVGLLSGGMFFLFTVSELSAPLSNRLFPVRIYLVMASVISLLFGIMLSESSAEEINVSHWICLAASLIFAFLVMVYGVNGMYEVSIRVREHCPRNVFLRGLFFLFSSVWGGGYILAFLLLCLVCFGTSKWLPAVTNSNLCFPMLNMVGYLMFYVAVTYILQMFIKRFSAGMLVTLVGVVFILLPFMVWFGLYLLNGNTPDSDFQAEKYWNLLMIPSALRYIPETVDGMQFNTWKDYVGNLIGIWFCLLGTLCIFPLIVKQFIGFHKPTEDEWKQLMTPQQKKD